MSPSVEAMSYCQKSCCLLRLGCVVGVTALVLAGAGCSAGFNQRRASSTTTTYLRTIQQVNTADHLAYMGSDAQFHYVFHSQLFGGGTYRIPLSAWRPRRTFPLRKDEPYVLLPSDFPLPSE